MTFRNKLAVHVAPLLLRFALAAVFIFYGWGKMFHTTQFEGANAATLANLGLITVPAEATPEVLEEETPAFEEAPDPAPEEEPDAAPTEDDASGENGPPAENGDGEGEDAPAAAARHGGLVILPVQNGAAAQPRYTAADFPEPVEGSRRLSLVLAMEATSRGGYWPGFLSSPTAYGMLAWIVTIIEFVGGWLVLLGFLTRFWALGFAGAMLGAAWMTQFVPVLVGARPDLWGFLPDPMMDRSASSTSRSNALRFPAPLRANSRKSASPSNR